MALDPNTMIQNLLAGTGYGRTPGDFGVQNQQIQSNDQILQINRLKLAAAQQAQADDQQFQQDAADYNQNPTVPKLASMMFRYPDKVAAIKAGHDALSEPARQARLSQYSQLFSAAKNKDTAALAKKLGDIITAEKGQGNDTSDAEELQADLAAGSSDAVNHVLAYAQAHLAITDPTFAKDIGAVGGEKYASAGDGTVFNTSTGEIKGTPREKPSYQKVDVFDDMGTKIGEKIVRLGGESSAPGTTAGQPAPSGKAPSADVVSGGQLDPKAFYKDFVLPHEGGYNPHDANGAPVNYGINQASHPNIDVKNLTPDGAADIFASEYATTKNMPPALAAAYNDTNFIGPAAAPILLEKSGGDVNKFLAMRQAWQASLIRRHPEKYGRFAKAWATRNADLASYVQQLGGGTSPAPAGDTSQGGNVVYDSTAGRPAGSGNAIPGDTTKTGDEYLATLPSNMAAPVRLLASGQMAFPTSFAQTKPFWQHVIAAAQHYDPEIASETQPGRVATFKAFTGNGKAAQVASSGNRLAYHLNDLYRDSLALSGPNLGWTPLSNFAANRGQSFQGPAVARYNAVLPFISGELQKLTKNGTATEGETKLIMANLQPGQSTEARNAAIQQTVELAEGQFRPFRDQWESTFGTNKPPPVDFTPTTLKIFDHITNGKDPVTVDANGHIVEPKGGASTSAAPHAATAGAPIPAGAVYLGTHQGRPIYRVNGKNWTP